MRGPLENPYDEGYCGVFDDVNFKAEEEAERKEAQEVGRCVMAAGTLSKPGTKYGPCKAECGHIDCRKTREMAASNCTICGNPIGYDTRFYLAQLIDNRYDHAECREDRDVMLGILQAVDAYFYEYRNGELSGYEHELAGEVSAIVRKATAPHDEQKERRK